MVTDIQKEEILNRFCDLYEGREKEIGCYPLVYGDLLLVAQEMAIPISEIAMVLYTEMKTLGFKD